MTVQGGVSLAASWKHLEARQRDYNGLSSRVIMTTLFFSFLPDLLQRSRSRFNNHTGTETYQINSQHEVFNPFLWQWWGFYFLTMNLNTHLINTSCKSSICVAQIRGQSSSLVSLGLKSLTRLCSSILNELTERFTSGFLCVPYGESQTWRHADLDRDVDKWWGIHLNTFTLVSFFKLWLKTVALIKSGGHGFDSSIRHLSSLIKQDVWRWIKIMINCD